MTKFYIFLVFTIFNLSSAWASSIEIKVLKKKGEILVVRNNKKYKLNKSFQFHHGDFIRTSKTGYLKIVLKKSIITLAPESTFEVPSAEKTDKSQSNKEKEINHGKLWYGHLKISLKGNQKDKHTLHFPTSAMAIRGTTVMTHITLNKKDYLERYKGNILNQPSISSLKSNFKPYTQVCCIEGMVDYYSEDGTKVKVLTQEILKKEAHKKEPLRHRISEKTIKRSAMKLGLEF